MTVLSWYLLDVFSYFCVNSNNHAKSEGKFLWANRYCPVGFLYQAELLVQTENVHVCCTTEPEVQFKHFLQFQTLASQSNNHAKWAIPVG